MKTRLLALILLLAPSPTWALTGTEIYEWCVVRDDPFHRTYCASYVRGLMDGLLIGDLQAQIGKHYCPPHGYTIQQGELIIEKYMRDHPELLAMDAGIVASRALYIAFSCPNAK